MPPQVPQHLPSKDAKILPRHVVAI
jgi:hypothetical protein